MKQFHKSHFYGRVSEDLCPQTYTSWLTGSFASRKTIFKHISVIVKRR